MAFTPKTWQNAPSTSTPISAAALVDIETRLSNYTDSTVASSGAPLASPAFTGVPTAPTAVANTNTTQLATTAYVVGQGYLDSTTAQTVTGAKTMTNLFQKGGKVFDVRAYGAIADDSTDAATAFTNAAADANASGGILYAPGKYRVSAGFALSSNVTLRGAGAQNSQIRKTGNFDLVTLNGTATGYATHTHFASIKDITLHGGSFTGRLVDLCYVDNIVIRDVFLTANNGIALDIVECYDSTFDNVAIDSASSTTEPSIWVRSSRAASGFGYSGDNSNNLRFNNCRIESWKFAAFKSEIGTGGVAAPNRIWMDKAKIESYFIMGHAIHLSAGNDIWITHSIIHMGGFNSGYSTASTAIRCIGPGITGAVRDILITNASTATVSEGVFIDNGTPVDLDNIYGVYTTNTTTGYHVNINGGGPYGRIGTIRASGVTKALRMQGTGTTTYGQGPITRLPTTDPTDTFWGSTNEPPQGTLAVRTDRKHFWVRTGDSSEWRYAALKRSPFALASSGTLTVGSDAGIIDITGTTQINGINSTYDGHEITLRFSTIVVVSNSANINLLSNFTGDTSRTLTLVCDGTNWKEKSRESGAELLLKAPLASPTFTGTPSAPTAAPGTNTTQLATTAYVAANSVNQTLVDVKGDLLVGTTADTLARFAVGSNADAVVADSTTASGVRWTPREHGIGRIEFYGHSLSRGGATDVNKNNIMRVGALLGAEIFDGTYPGGAQSTSHTGLGFYANGWSYQHRWPKALNPGVRLHTSSSHGSAIEWEAARGCVVFNQGYNDVGAFGTYTSAADTQAFRNSMIASISRARAGSVFAWGHASIAAGGSGNSTVSSGTWPIIHGTGSLLSTATVNGATRTVTTPADFTGGVVALQFICNNGQGGSWSVSVDGGASTTVDSTKYAVAAGATLSDWGWCPVIFRSGVLSAGTHTISATWVKGSATTGYFDSWWNEATVSPLIGVCNAAANSMTTVQNDLLNDAIDAVVATFADTSTVFLIDIESVLNYTAYPAGPTSATDFADTVHYNDRGHRKVAEKIVATLLDRARTRAANAQGQGGGTFVTKSPADLLTNTITPNSSTVPALVLQESYQDVQDVTAPLLKLTNKDGVVVGAVGSKGHQVYGATGFGTFPFGVYTAAGDSLPVWGVDGAGNAWWGAGGATTPDVFLYRVGVDVLGVPNGDSLRAVGATTSNYANVSGTVGFNTRGVAGIGVFPFGIYAAAADTLPVWGVDGASNMYFGAGGTTSPDVTVSRPAASTLAVSGTLRATDGLWKPILQASGSATGLGGLNTNVSLFNGDGTATNTGTGREPKMIYLLAADYQVTGRTLQMILRGTLRTNSTSPGITVTFGLYPISSPTGGANILSVTAGTAVATFSIVTAATQQALGSSSTITVPADGFYALGVTGSGTQAANSFLGMSLQVLVKNT